MKRNGCITGGTILFLLLASLLGCSGMTDKSGKEKGKDVIVATVDAGEITMEDLKREILDVRGFSSTLDVSGATREEIVKALQRLIRKTLIIEEAKDMGVDVVEDEVDREIEEIKLDYPEGTFGKLLLKEGIDEKVWREKLKRTLLIKKASEIIKDRATPATQKELYRYLANNNIRLKKKEVVPERWHLMEYVFVTMDDADKANELVRNSDGTRDRKIIESALIDVTVYDLGYLSKKEIGKEYVKDVTSLEENQVSKIIKLPSSYAFFRVVKREAQHVKKQEEAVKEIKERISMQKREAYLSEWLQKRYNECTIKVNEAALGRLEGEKTKN